MGKQSAINVQPLNMYARVATARDACAQVGGRKYIGYIGHPPPFRPVCVYERASERSGLRRLFPWPVGTAAWLAPPYLHVISRLFVQVGNSTAPLPLASPQFGHFFYFQRELIRDSTEPRTRSHANRPWKAKTRRARDGKSRREKSTRETDSSRLEEPVRVGRESPQTERIHIVLLKLSLFHKKYESLDLNISLPTLRITILFFFSSSPSFFYTLDVNDGQAGELTLGEY